MCPGENQSSVTMEEGWTRCWGRQLEIFLIPKHHYYFFKYQGLQCLRSKVNNYLIAIGAFLFFNTTVVFRAYLNRDKANKAMK